MTRGRAGESGFQYRIPNSLAEKYVRIEKCRRGTPSLQMRWTWSVIVSAIVQSQPCQIFRYSENASEEKDKSCLGGALFGWPFQHQLFLSEKKNDTWNSK
mmetsp:Transcript_18228/g.33941  ORF Transcript_18228/g.33941 Transcript_18228/m.33941 type:complete len:100 (-) Transcript_18228:38-337(-)